MAAFYADYVKSENKDFIKKTLNEIRNPFEIAVYGTKNSYNFGAIIRTGHCFLTKGYYAIDIPWYYHKAAMTAKQWEKELITNCSIDQFLEVTRDRNVVAFEKKDDGRSCDLRVFEYPENPILLFGSEDDGVPKELLAACSHVVTIPMWGLVNSLNVACAAGIAMYDFQAKALQKNLR